MGGNESAQADTHIFEVMMERVQKAASRNEPASAAASPARRSETPDSPQLDVASRINNSPGMVAQSERLQNMFGAAAQLPELRGGVKPALQAKGRPVSDGAGLEHEADVMGERTGQHMDQGQDTQVTKQFLTYPPIRKSRSVAQLKAGVESFTAKWSDDKRGGTGAGFRIDYAAKFRDGAGFTAADAEFRQHAADKWKRVTQAGVTTEGATGMEDDHYSRKNDPGDYDGQNFKAEDLPGFKAGQLAATDNITWEFWADQYIVDTSSKNEVIACIPTQNAKITGADPRDFSKPADKDAVIKR